MATTEIHAITKTPGAALSYIMSDKVVEYSDDMAIWDDCEHRLTEENGKKYIVYNTYTSFYHCNRQNPLQTYTILQNKWQNKRRKGGVGAKNGEPLMYHMHQSFKGREVDPVTAQEIAQKFCEEVFKGFAVTVSTHTNGDNIHTHYILSAWNYEGRKWNDNHASKRKIREVSDKLCKEYGLSVLENTKDMKLISYKDAEGKTHYYEPTDRKNDLIRQREDGEISTDDIGSYRNTKQYDELKAKELSNRDIVKRDIDNLLSSCRSFEELIMRLRNMGYTVKDKKKNGDWLAHISYQPPTAEKPTREDKIGDGEFYLRENLTAYLEDRERNLHYALGMEVETIPQQEEAESNQQVCEDPDRIPYFERYEYGVTDISQIDIDWRKKKDVSGREYIVPRTATEKKVITDIRRNDIEVRGLIDTASLRRLIVSQNQRRKERKPYLTYTQEQRLVARINTSFRCLQYTEQNNIFSQRQIVDLFRANKMLCADINKEILKAQKAIQMFREVMSVPDKVKEIKARIQRGAGDLAYRLEQEQEDLRLLKEYQLLLQKYKINTPEGMSALTGKVEQYEAKTTELQIRAAQTFYHMRELENCMRTYDRIDRQYGIADDAAMREFLKLLHDDEDGGGSQRREAETKKNNEQAKGER